MDMTNAHQSQVAFMLQEAALEIDGQVSQWGLMGTSTMARKSYGGFAGVNGQWENVIFGLELNYNIGGFNATSSGAMRRLVTPTNGLLYDTTVTARLR